MATGTVCDQCRGFFPHSQAMVPRGWLVLMEMGGCLANPTDLPEPGQMMLVQGHDHSQCPETRQVHLCSVRCLTMYVQIMDLSRVATMPTGEPLTARPIPPNPPRVIPARQPTRSSDYSRPRRSADSTEPEPESRADRIARRLTED